MAGEITKQNEQVVEVLPPEPDTRALNAVTHGLTAEHVPPSERAAYAQHAEQVRASTGAQGYLEQRLSDRAALALWRLDRVARYEAAQSALSQRAMAGCIVQGGVSGPAGAVTAAYGVLGELLKYPTPEQLHNLQTVEQGAKDLEDEAAYLLGIAQGGSAAGCSEDEAYTLGEALYKFLSMSDVPPRDMVRAMMGRPPKRGEADSVAEGGWTYEPEEIPGLLDLYRSRVPEFWAVRLQAEAAQRYQKAQEIRAAQREAQAVELAALDVAALPGEDELQKVTRYEAHLERVLYRALHDLEASRLRREGKEPGAPVRVVFE